MIDNNKVPAVNTIIADKLSLLRKGRWEFAMPTGNATITPTGKVYLPINYKFGIVMSNVFDPSTTQGRGNIGDYLFWNNLNFDGYSIVSKKTYNNLFPKKIDISTRTQAVSSSRLKEPNFYNNIVAQYEQGTSNIATGSGVRPSTDSVY
jgi:hypothetical protein